MFAEGRERLRPLTQGGRRGKTCTDLCGARSNARLKRSRDSSPVAKISLVTQLFVVDLKQAIGRGIIGDLERTKGFQGRPSVEQQKRDSG
jgi:hypothetical protein